MTNSVKTYRFKLENKRSRKWQLQRREKLLDQLKKLKVKIDKPYEMAIEELEKLIFYHVKTMEKEKELERL